MAHGASGCSQVPALWQQEHWGAGAGIWGQLRPHRPHRPRAQTFGQARCSSEGRELNLSLASRRPFTCCAAGAGKGGNAPDAKIGFVAPAASLGATCVQSSRPVTGTMGSPLPGSEAAEDGLLMLLSLLLTEKKKERD